MPGRRLPRATPESRGLPSGAVAAFLDAAADSQELHSLMVVVRGAVVAEGWWAPYEPDRPHYLFSLSKSVTSTAVGFAVAEGLLSVDDRVVDHLPEDVPAQPHPNLGSMRIRHLLTMTTGHDTDATDATFAAPHWVRAFLALPVDHEPGSHFVYNAAATYVLAAIVQRVTGERLLDYLTPRLLDPLGVEGATWEQSPQGVDVGGFGLSMTTEDVACLAELYRCDGRWADRQVLPPGWAAQASARHTASRGTGPEEPGRASDWTQGYGFQFWRGRHGTYRGDGAFGQFALVLPDQQAVVAITAGTGDMQGLLDLVWAHLLPALATRPDAVLPPDEAAAGALRRRLAGLRLDSPVGDALPTVDLSGRPLAFEPNPHGVESAVVTAGPSGVRLDVRLADDVVVGLDAGYGTWVPGVLPQLAAWQGARPDPRAADPTVPVACAAAWATPDTLLVTVQLVGSPLGLHLTVRYDGDVVRVSADLNAWFRPTHVADLVGVLA